MPKIADVEAMLGLYGADSAQAAMLIQLVRDAQQRGWWMAFNDVFTGSFVGLEDEASLIRSWQAQLGALGHPDFVEVVHGDLPEPVGH